jgi:hypothetical protein
MKNWLNILINRFILKKNHSNIDNDVRKVFSNTNLIGRFLKKYSIEDISLEDIKKHRVKLEKIDNFDQLVFLYKVFFSLGHILNALKIRQYLIEKISYKDTKNFKDYFNKINSLIECGRLKEALKITKKIQLSFILSPKYYLFLIYRKNICSLIKKILFREKANFHNLGVLNNFENEKKFSNLIKDKKIALVGPGFSSINNGPEIDSYDLVIRLNIFESLNFDTTNIYGSKTDIVYFNGGLFNRIEKNGRTRFLEKKFICTRKNFSGQFINKNIRSTRKLNLNLMGANGFIQDILIDLLHFDYKEIKIFNVDFTLNKKMYFGNYSKPNVETQKNWYNVQGKLDFFSNINFIRMLEKNRIIHVDNILQELLKRPNNILASEFKKIYDISSNKIN